ncbi:hypothetical protein FHS56_001236 [Thermonema lapsum]|uniref:Uncharacterized protein n=1 Tax=Thermonema lapsum TaxID=28195 RepID=A0A846MQ83_9BACT|nr:hypothetical protein [Thermonema lapsum]NIK73723.1 hypothetical protein [Thermonema lapsum]
MKNISWFYLILCVFFLGACGESIEEGASSTMTTAQDSARKASTRLSPEVIKGIIQSIPNPVEIAFLIEQIAEYDPTLLNSPQNVSKYNTDYRRALNLGIYSTDLGYANTYGKSQDVINYLSATRDLANGLNVEKYFDFEHIRKLAAYKDSLGVLVMESTRSLERMNEALQNEGRTDMTILILTGGWLEGLYLLCNVEREQHNEELAIRIAEQKIVLEQLLVLLRNYEDYNPKIKRLRSQLEELAALYEHVEVKYVPGKVKQVEIDGVLTIEQEQKAEVKFTLSDLNAILSKVREIRNQIVN